MDNPNKPAACGCSVDVECPAHRFDALVHEHQGWDDVPGHAGIDPADDLLDL